MSEFLLGGMIHGFALYGHLGPIDSKSHERECMSGLMASTFNDYYGSEIAVFGEGHAAITLVNTLFASVDS